MQRRIATSEANELQADIAQEFYAQQVSFLSAQADRLHTAAIEGNFEEVFQFIALFPKRQERHAFLRSHKDGIEGLL